MLTVFGRIIHIFRFFKITVRSRNVGMLRGCTKGSINRGVSKPFPQRVKVCAYPYYLAVIIAF